MLEGKQIETYVVVGPNKKKKICKRDMLSSNCAREEQQGAKNIFVLLALPMSAPRKSSRSSNHHYTRVSIMRYFDDNV